MPQKFPVNFMVYIKGMTSQSQPYVLQIIQGGKVS